MVKKRWEPEDFELEMTTHWSFPKRELGDAGCQVERQLVTVHTS